MTGAIAKLTRQNPDSSKEKLMIKTFRTSMQNYGPFADGRAVFDALHHDTVLGQWAEQVGYQHGSQPVMQYPCSRERVNHLARCQGGQELADYLAEAN